MRLRRNGDTCAQLNLGPTDDGAPLPDTRALSPPTRTDRGLAGVGTWTGVVAIILFVSFADDLARAMVWVSGGWVHPVVALALGGTVVTTITLVLPGRLAARYIKPLSFRRALLYGAASGLLLAAVVLFASATAPR